jgi:hypothetical protein
VSKYEKHLEINFRAINEYKPPACRGLTWGVIGAQASWGQANYFLGV